MFCIYISNGGTEQIIQTNLQKRNEGEDALFKDLQWKTGELVKSVFCMHNNIFHIQYYTCCVQCFHNYELYIIHSEYVVSVYILCIPG